MRPPFSSGAAQFVKRGGLSDGEPSLCWEIARVLILVALMVAIVLGASYVVGQQMGDLPPLVTEPAAAMHDATLDDDDDARDVG